MTTDVAEPSALARAEEAGSRVASFFPVRVLRKFMEHGGGSQAVLIAWNALTAIFPIGLALAAIGGLILARVGVSSATIAQHMGSLFPSDLGTQRAVLDGMDSLRKSSGLFAILALVGFVWTGSSLFGAMEEAFGVVFQVRGRPFLRQKLMAIGMMGLFAVLALLGVGTSALLPVLNDIPGLPISLTKGSTDEVIQVGIGLLSGFLLFVAIYMIVPNRRQRISRVLPAALFAGVAFELLSLLFPAYVALNGAGINRFGSQFALLFVLLAFFYFLGLITVLGADINAVLDPPDPARARRPDTPAVTAATEPARRMGRARRVAFGAGAFLIGVFAGRRSRML